MNSDTRSEETLFAAALAMPEAARAAYLDQACGSDATLRASVEALLRAHLAAAGFMPSIASIPRPVVGPDSRAEEQPGDWIGRYKILQKIGEGGCGIVYMAEQEEPIRRRVALKVIKLGMDTKAVIARFEAERQALAMMDHPNIAKVFDAGATDSGRPFFVMELVRGVPVTKYCDEQGLATEQRLELFSRICQAIQHAHQKGIIHRDIKPSNILVTLHDGVPVPKVIDFGIAKATQGKLTDHTYFTAFEQFVGTPAYMSPEQAEMSGLDIDTRSDIYSLGVLLYELLSGRPPFDPKTFLAAGLDEMRRVIREVDPPKPSVRLSTLAEADQTTVAKQRGTAAAQLSTALAGDLDWIVMRCIEKDRTRRYAAPSELVADIERHLRNEPVVACPPSTGYLLRKLMLRHKFGVAAGAAVAVSLVAGLAVSWGLLMRERRMLERAVKAEATEIRLRREAEQARTDAEQVARFMREMLEGMGPNAARGRDFKVVLRETLDATTKRLETEFSDQPAVAADLRDALGSLYFDIGQYAEAEPLLRAAVAAHRSVSGNASEKTAASLYLLGQVLHRRSRFAEAETMLQEALTIRQTLFGPGHRAVEDTLSELAEVADAKRSPAGRRAVLEEVLINRRKELGNDHLDVATALFRLGQAAVGEVDHVTAARLHEEALAIRRRKLPADHLDLAASLNALGFSYAHELDRKSDAAIVYREAFDIRHKTVGDGHPRTVATLLQLTGQLPARDVSRETLDLTREFVEGQRALLTPGSALLAPSLLALATLENVPERDPKLAQALLQEARDILAQTGTDGAPLEADLVYAMMFFAWSKFVVNAPAEGLVMGEEAWKLAPTTFDDTDLRAMNCAHTLAWLYVALGRHDEAATLFEFVVPRFGVRLGEGFPMTLVDVAALGACYCATNRSAKSRELLSTTLAALEAKLKRGDANPHLVYVRGQLGLTLLHEGRWEEAEAMLRRAFAEYDHPELRRLNLRLHPLQRVTSGLGQALAAQGKFAEAAPFVVSAFQELHANEHRIAGNRSAMVREAFDAVIALYTAWGKLDQVTEWKTKFSDTDSTSRQPVSLSPKKI